MITHNTPFKLIVKIILFIFLAEILVMLVVSLFQVKSLFLKDIIDAVLLILICLPPLYYFLYRPTTEYIKDLNKKEEEIQKEIKLTRTLLDNMPCATLLIKPISCEIVAANKTAIEQGAIVGKQCFQTWGKRTERCPWCMAPELWAKAKPQYAEVNISDHVYDTFWIPVTESLYLHYAFDITERKRLENELREAHQHLEKQVEERTAELKSTHAQLLHAEKLGALGKLAASVAHEFNNPIYGIRMSLEQLGENTHLNKKKQKLLNMALRECDRITRLISNMQDFYRPSAARATAVDIHRLIEDVLQISEKRLNLDKIKVVRNFARDMPMVSVVNDQIKQVFLNIITNAQEAMTLSGGQLTIQTIVLDSAIQILFKDDGPGISDENLGKIFDPFFTTKADVKGSGLGLSVSYGIIKNHKGNIIVKSTPNEGSIFTVELPV
jgi:signal transduction histidine kinase